eukprot:16242680-Heterocapsa_arctica.AAC.1
MSRKELRDRGDHTAVRERLAELLHEGAAATTRDLDLVRQLRSNPAELHLRSLVIGLRRRGAPGRGCRARGLIPLDRGSGGGRNLACLRLRRRSRRESRCRQDRGGDGVPELALHDCRKCFALRP